MAIIRVVIVDERGNEVSEGIIIPSVIFPNIDNMRFVLIRFIDPYGNTIFNRPQIPVVLSDLKILEETVSEHKQKELVKQLEALCEKYLDEPHHYLKLIGD